MGLGGVQPPSPTSSVLAAASLWMNGNAVLTDVPGPGPPYTPVLIAGSTTASLAIGFTAQNMGFVYDGPTRYFNVEGDASASGAGTRTVTVYIAINGVPVTVYGGQQDQAIGGPLLQYSTAGGLFQLNTGDLIQLFVDTSDGASIRIERVALKLFPA